MSTTSSHQDPSAHGARRHLSASASGLHHRNGAPTRAAATAAYKLIIWATVGFVVLALLNTAMGR